MMLIAVTVLPVLGASIVRICANLFPEVETLGCSIQLQLVTPHTRKSNR